MGGRFLLAMSLLPLEINLWSSTPPSFLALRCGDWGHFTPTHHTYTRPPWPPHTSRDLLVVFLPLYNAHCIHQISFLLFFQYIKIFRCFLLRRLFFCFFSCCSNNLYSLLCPSSQRLLVIASGQKN